MKRQLGFDIPAGFCGESIHQQNYRYLTPPRQSKLVQHESFASLPDSSLEFLVDSTSTTPAHNNTRCDTIPSTPSSNPPINIPIIHSVDKVSSSLHKVVTMLEDYLHGCVGFRCIDTLKQNHHIRIKILLNSIILLQMLS
jgi:hypothetical protein